MMYIAAMLFIAGVAGVGYFYIYDNQSEDYGTSVYLGCAIVSIILGLFLGAAAWIWGG